MWEIFPGQATHNFVCLMRFWIFLGNPNICLLPLNFREYKDTHLYGDLFIFIRSSFYYSTFSNGMCRISQPEWFQLKIVFNNWKPISISHKLVGNNKYGNGKRRRTTTTTKINTNLSIWTTFQLFNVSDPFTQSENRKLLSLLQFGIIALRAFLNWFWTVSLLFEEDLNSISRTSHFHLSDQLFLSLYDCNSEQSLKFFYAFPCCYVYQRNRQQQRWQWQPNNDEELLVVL